MATPSRREIISVAAATITLPMQDSALGKMRSVSAANTGRWCCRQPPKKPFRKRPAG